LIGGHLALDFSNTVAWRLRDDSEDRLPTYATLVRWARTMEILSAPQAKRLLRIASRRPASARGALRRACALRDAIFDAAAAASEGKGPSESAAGAIHGARVAALGRARLSWIDGHCELTWVGREADLDRAWWPVAVAAAELLESNELGRVRMCAGQGCGWLFLDRSRNNSRRWCASGDCGNRARVDRFRARQQRGVSQ
jgi:predicted RNA-binding Zn ribbon-like protein